VTIKANDPCDFHRQMYVGVHDQTHIVLRLISPTNQAVLPPVVLALGSGAGHFQEYLTPEQAVELAKALSSAALHAKHPDGFPSVLRAVDPEDGAA
jgi:hypothetical protein